MPTTNFQSTDLQPAQTNIPVEGISKKMDAVLENWIRKESYSKAFSKDDAFIGEIRLHNVLCNQIPSAMLSQGYSQQIVRKGLLQLIDDGFAEELRKESLRRRMRRPTGTAIANVPGASESIPVETDALLENWIRKESSRVAFSKEGAYIGEIRLHNILCNCIPASMLGQGYTPQAVRKSLLKIIDEGFSEELQKESRRRRGLGKPDATSVVGTNPFAPLSESVKTAVPIKQGLQSPKLATIIGTISLNSQIPASEMPRPPFCVQHGILTALQSRLEAACFKFSETHCPSLLARRNWSCPHAGELNAWTKELQKSFNAGELPVSTLADDPTHLTLVLKELDDLRHTAVHRVPISGAKLVEFIGTAGGAVRMLGDEKGVGEIEEIMAVVDGCLGESRRCKTKLNSTLNQELEVLEREKEKLRQRELQVRQAAVEEAKKVDAELERSMMKGLDALKLHIHAVESTW